jgi:hypothetical protein
MRSTSRRDQTPQIDHVDSGPAVAGQPVEDVPQHEHADRGDAVPKLVMFGHDIGADAASHLHPLRPGGDALAADVLLDAFPNLVDGRC